MNKKLLILTGTPGTGKSTLAKKLAGKLGFDRLDLHHYYRQLSVGYNRQKQCYDIDVKKLEKLVREKLSSSKKGLILDSHLAHLLPKKLVTLCLVLTCSDLKQLQRRLKKRNYPPAKIRENLEAEIFRVCLEEAREQGHRLIVLDTAKPFSFPTLLRQIRKSL